MSKVRTGEDRRTKQASQSQQSPRNGDTIFKEDLQASRKIERFTIPLDNLKMMFERPSRIVVMPRKSSRKKVRKVFIWQIGFTLPLLPLCHHVTIHY